jgi:predicted secreted Zn-dependent protease
VRRLNLLLLALVLLCGCESINDAFVRRAYQEWGVSRRTRAQIWKGLERRKDAPPQTGPRVPAPAFMDQG